MIFNISLVSSGRTGMELMSKFNQNQWSRNMLLIQKLSHIGRHLVFHGLTELKTSDSWN